jgi:hypothetical protein
MPTRQMSKNLLSINRVVTNVLSKDGKTEIKTYWENVNSYTKRGLLLYSFISIILFGTYNYRDGKNALMKIRTEKPQCTVSEEITAVKNGFNPVCNFFQSLFFPYSLGSRIVPSIIIYMNPK